MPQVSLALPAELIGGNCFKGDPMYQALYRSFRPETFETLLGQEHIERILKNQLATGTTGHAYIFCGTRGTGKTTTARLLAKALNCTGSGEKGEKPCGLCPSCRAIAEGSFVDVMEIDAASNRGVDDIRELRDTVNFPPIQGRCKVYIIDEAHMLTKEAANAFLKTLEEPPANVVFILATTEPEKLPATILSRCLRLDFRRVSEDVLIKRFGEICKEIGCEMDTDALALIAANADGSVRDGLSLLDRCVSLGSRITREDVLSLLGMAGSETYMEITDCVLSCRTGEALAVLARALSEGKEVTQFAKDWVEHFRNLMIIKYTKEPERVLNLSMENIERLRKQAAGISIGRIRQCVLQLSKALADAKWSPRPRILFELAIITMSEGEAGEEPAFYGSTAQDAKVPSRTAAESREETRTERSGEAPASVPAEPCKPEVKPLARPEIQSEAKPEADFRPEAKPEALKAVPPETWADGPEEDELWMRILEDGRIPPMIRMAGTQLRGMNSREFTVQVRNSVFEDQLKKNAALFEELMEFETGKKLKLVTIVKE